MKEKVFKILSIVFILILFVPILTACQSTDKSETYLNTEALDKSIFNYDSINDRTEIIWATTITNGTIYNLKNFSIKFKLYNGEEFVDEIQYDYSCVVNHGKEYTGAFSFIHDGKVDGFKYVGWSGTYATFWETYRIWLIVSIIVSSVLTLVYFMIIIMSDLDFDDFISIFEGFDDNLWLLGPFVIPFGVAIYSSITDNWVPSIIVGVAAIALIILIIILYFVLFIINNFNSNTQNNHKSSHKKIEGNNDNTENDLTNFTLKELKEYCRENNIQNYSTLSKSELINLINSNKGTKIKNPISKITFEDIAGLETAKQAFREKVILAFEYKELYEKYGKKAGGGILLYGLPGTGKTMFAEAASNETDSLFIPIKCSDIKSKWYGESESNIKKIFDKARKAGKAIIFFDEFEAIGAKRTGDSNNGNNDLVPQILAEMQGVNKKSNAIIVVIAATNKPWAIDSAFLRPGRFDEKIYIPLPDMEARVKLCELKLSKVPTKDIDYNKLAEMTEGFNGADITEFCEKLKMEAIRKSIESNNEHVIDMEDVMAIMPNIKSSVSEEDISKLKEFESKF